LLLLAGLSGEPSLNWSSASGFGGAHAHEPAAPTAVSAKFGLLSVAVAPPAGAVMLASLSVFTLKLKAAILAPAKFTLPKRTPTSIVSVPGGYVQSFWIPAVTMSQSRAP
jgi:hypothetical protein